jgi:hypothetical protein
MKSEAGRTATPSDCGSPAWTATLSYF